jgi:hypothetical protein
MWDYKLVCKSVMTAPLGLVETGATRRLIELTYSMFDGSIEFYW